MHVHISRLTSAFAGGSFPSDAGGKRQTGCMDRRWIVLSPFRLWFAHTSFPDPLSLPSISIRMDTLLGAVIINIFTTPYMLLHLLYDALLAQSRCEEPPTIIVHHSERVCFASKAPWFMPVRLWLLLLLWLLLCKDRQPIRT